MNNENFLNLGVARCSVEFVFDRVRFYKHRNFERAFKVTSERLMNGTNDEARKQAVRAEVARIKGNLLFWTMVQERYQAGSREPLIFGAVALVPLGDLDLEKVIRENLGLPTFDESTHIVF